MFLDDYMNSYIFIRIVYICDIQNLCDTMAWLAYASNIAYFNLIENFSSLGMAKRLFNILFLGN